LGAVTVLRMDHVGVVVDDLPAAIAFFIELGLELDDEVPAEGRWVDRIIALDGVRLDIAMMRTPDGSSRLELTKFHAPSGRIRAACPREHRRHPSHLLRGRRHRGRDRAAETPRR
jgi:catechol 2,3-dioxygenase-like lactoylglutathione lyase family enzyme